MLFALITACLSSPPADSSDSPNPVVSKANVQSKASTAVLELKGRRMVAIGDLHGDREASVAVLRLAGLVNEAEEWTGGSAVLVQTGDTTDRGPDSKGVIDLLRSLVEPAAAAGGQVVMLNGNHEVMNLQGDWRYVSDADVAGFGGIEKRKAAMSPSGDYGRFLRTLPVVAQIDDTVFVHGGLVESFAELGIDGVNAVARQHYGDTPGPLGHPVHGNTGPTWYRGYVQEEESKACALLARTLKRLGARRMIVGHTTQRTGKVLSRCDGGLAVIDVGISAHYGGHLGVWELVNGDARFLTPGGVVDLPDPSGVASESHPE